MLSTSDDANLTSGNAPRLGFGAVGSSGLFRHTDLTAAYVGLEDTGISCCLPASNSFSVPLPRGNSYRGGLREDGCSIHLFFPPVIPTERSASEPERRSVHVQSASGQIHPFCKVSLRS